jgi:hypothetical protein
MYIYIRCISFIYNIYIHIYIHINTNIYIYIHTQRDIHTHTNTHTHEHEHTCIHLLQTYREREVVRRECLRARRRGRVLRTSRTAAATTPSPGFKCPAGSPKSPSSNPVLCRLFRPVPSALRALVPSADPRLCKTRKLSNGTQAPTTRTGSAALCGPPTASRTQRCRGVQAGPCCLILGAANSAAFLSR